MRTEPLLDVDEWLQPYRELWALPDALDALGEHLAVHGGREMTPDGHEPPTADDLGHWSEVTVTGSCTFRRGFVPSGSVWRALTDPDHLQAWFPTTIEGELSAGAPLRFGFRDN